MSFYGILPSPTAGRTTVPFHRPDELYPQLLYHYMLFCRQQTAAGCEEGVVLAHRNDGDRRITRSTERSEWTVVDHIRRRCRSHFVDDNDVEPQPRATKKRRNHRVISPFDEEGMPVRGLLDGPKHVMSEAASNAPPPLTQRADGTNRQHMPRLVEVPAGQAQQEVGDGKSSRMSDQLSSTDTNNNNRRCEKGVPEKKGMTMAGHPEDDGPARHEAPAASKCPSLGDLLGKTPKRAAAVQPEILLLSSSSGDEQ